MENGVNSTRSKIGVETGPPKGVKINSVFSTLVGELMLLLIYFLKRSKIDFDSTLNLYGMYSKALHRNYTIGTDLNRLR